MNADAVPPRAADAVRRWARERSPQPFDDDRVVPPAGGSDWIYGSGQYELALLARLVDEGFAANRHVHYPRNHGRVGGSTSFTATATDAAEVRVRVSGTVTGATVDGRPIEVPSGDGDALRIALPAVGAELRVDVVAADGDVPAFVGRRGCSAARTGARASMAQRGSRCARGAAATSRRTSTRWARSTSSPAASGTRSSTSARPCSAGRSCRPARGPWCRAARASRRRWPTPTTTRRGTNWSSCPSGGWTTRHPLGFRYLVVRSDAPLDAVTVRASVPVVARPGAFACSDDQLTRIWAAAQYTLRLCMQGLMIDGIKRDRMPWAGDQALSTLANAYALGAGGIVADGLVALGRPVHGYVNGIADYSLWWVVNAELRLRYFGDEAFARREADRLDAFVADLARHAGHDGAFRPAAQRGGFVDTGPGSVFLDWGLALDHGRDAVALQMLWYWALRSAERALARTRHPGAIRWRDLADTLEATLRERAWLARHGRWADYLDARTSIRPATYANFLAVLAGMHDDDAIPAGVADAVRVGASGTPFMTAFRLRALLAAGESRRRARPGAEHLGPDARQRPRHVLGGGHARRPARHVRAPVRTQPLPRLGFRAGRDPPRGGAGPPAARRRLGPVRGAARARRSRVGLGGGARTDRRHRRGRRCLDRHGARSRRHRARTRGACGARARRPSSGRERVGPWSAGERWVSQHPGHDSHDSSGCAGIGVRAGIMVLGGVRGRAARGGSRWQ